MAAGQQKKRLNSPSVVSSNFQEQYRGKKKKNLEPSQYVLNMRPHISLEWDDIQKRAMAKREQIGITWRDMAPFITSVTQSHISLADVFPIPQEIFELENLTELLSYEVWKTHLSESERKVLVQFLPKETDVDQTVRSLLMGENVNFGNLFLTWGAALCSGNLHPDAVLHRDRRFKANKRAYYKELQKYHKGIFENLQKWKDKWTSCKDPENDIVEKIWSCPQKNEGNSLTTHVNESREHSPEENLAATADSCSWIMDEKACTGDKENTLGRKGGVPQERKVSGKLKDGNLSVASGKVKAFANSRKEEIPHKLQILSGNSAKYMSYIKISRKQHQLVKTIKQSGDGIQSKSLNRVLGDIKSFHVQPYETFEEEERKKLHEYWLQLVSRDLPEAFANCREIQWQRQQLKKSLDYEITERKRSLMGEDEEEKNPEPSTQEQEQGGETKERPSVDLQNCRDDDSIPQSTPCQPLQRIPSLNTHHELEPMVLDSEDCNQDILKQETTASNVSELEKREDDEPDTTTKDVWQAVTMTDSYYPPTSTRHGYTSAADLSLGQPQPIDGRPARLIDLETDIVEQEDGEPLLHGPTDDAALHIDNRAHMFPYANRDHTELLPPFLKEQRMLPSYPHDHMKTLKQHGLDFLTANDCPPENGQFPRQFQEHQQQRLLEQRQVREKELYMHQVMQKNMYSNGRYPSQEFFPSVGMQDWPADPGRTASFHSPINTGLLGHNWFPGEQRARNSWPGVQVSSAADQSLGQGGNTDGSLFSVLSQCSSLQSHSPYSSMNSDLHVPERNFVSGSVSGNGDVLAYSHQLNYLSSREATATTSSMKANNAPWMNLPPNPNSGLHDSVGKTFLRSWSQ